MSLGSACQMRTTMHCDCVEADATMGLFDCICVPSFLVSSSTESAPSCLEDRGPQCSFCGTKAHICGTHDTVRNGNTCVWRRHSSGMVAVSCTKRTSSPVCLPAGCAKMDHRIHRSGFGLSSCLFLFFFVGIWGYLTLALDGVVRIAYHFAF